MNWGVGRGIADITGEPAEAGMLGYGQAHQQSAGIHLRQRARAFVFDDGKHRVLLVVCEIPLMVQSIHDAVLAGLAAEHGAIYGLLNTMLTATHTHCGPGGYPAHLLYNMTTHGFRDVTFSAIVTGILRAVERADADLAPASLTLARSALRDASVNRSREAWARNPLRDREFFPDAVDPQSTTVQIERHGDPVGAVNFFACHATSMTNRNRLITSDNKGYAAYRWERLNSDVDYRATVPPSFIAAFAQTNAGDMSPNLNLVPGSGPTEDEFANTRIMGTRQSGVALAQPRGATMEPVVDARVMYVTLNGYTVRPEFTGDGRVHVTGGPAGGAAALAGAWADGKGYPYFHEGRNPLFDRLSRHVLYPLMPRLRDAQAPKGIALPGGLMNRLAPFAAERGPVQLLRIGPLYLIGIPAEVTITAGLRLRRTVAAIVGADLADVLVAGYANGYLHYVTTPEEYDAQQYEGGSTLFGRWELPALQQVLAELATAMHLGRPVAPGLPPADLSHRHRGGRHTPPADAAHGGWAFGDVEVEPAARYASGEVVEVVFVGGHPNHDLHHEDTYLEVQRADSEGWRTVADDGDWCTRLHWKRVGKRSSRITVHYDAGAHGPGDFRIVYRGDVRDAAGVHPVTGTTSTFTVG